MGTHYQDGSLIRSPRKRGPDVWEFRWYESGRRRCKVVGNVKKYPRESDVQKVLAPMKLRINIDSDMPVLVTFGMAASHYRENELQKRTHHTQKTNAIYINKWILPKWGDLLLEQVKTMVVEGWLETLDLANGSKAKIRDIMNAIYRHAMRHEWVNHNPISLVRQSSKRERVPVPLTLQEVRYLLGQLERREFLAVLLANCCGWRRSELAGFKWSDINWEEQFAKVSRSIVDQVVGGGKTEVSLKPVPLDDFLIAKLAEWRRESVYSCDDDFVFAADSNRAGEKKGKQPVWLATIMRYHIKPAAERAGITKPIGWHTFRHTFSTLLKANREDVKVVQELMRHANSRTTLDDYTQAEMESKRRAQSKLVQLVVHGGTSAVAAGRPN